MQIMQYCIVLKMGVVQTIMGQVGALFSCGARGARDKIRGPKWGPRARWAVGGPPEGPRFSSREL